MIGLRTDESIPNGGLGDAVGHRDGVKKIASFMVNRESCPEMRQNDRSCLVGESVGGGEKGRKIRIWEL